MEFNLIPTFDIMIDLYRQPRNLDRFQAYLKILHGASKGDLVIPVSAYNPMAKDHVLVKLLELKEIGAEEMFKEEILALNKTYASFYPEINLKIAINLSDDLMGGWTNRYTSDYQSKFELNALINRHFCTPIFWTTELYTKEMVRNRILAYVYRSIYCFSNPKPVSLKEHLAQEVFVSDHFTLKSHYAKSDFKMMDDFYDEHKDSDNYHHIFNFFYGDEASKVLGFPSFGITEPFNGFKYTEYLAAKDSDSQD